MAEYICRDKAIELIQPRVKPSTVYGEGYLQAIKHASEMLALMPAADVQPVKHGRWLNHHAIWIGQPEIEGWFVQAKCSKCEKWAHVMNPYTKSVDYELCPNCGARMDGVKK